MRHTRPRALAGSLALTAALLAPTAVLAGPAGASDSGLPGDPGSDWIEVVHGHPSGQNTYLYDVWVAGEEAWSVGTRRIDVGGGTEFRTWAQRCVGDTCTATYPRDLESPPSTSNALQGVSGTSSSDVWAVGAARSPSGSTVGTTHHFDGATWTLVPNPVTNGALYGVSAVSSVDVWAVGAEGSFAPQTPVVLHWDGSSWSRVPFALKGGCTPYDVLDDIDAHGRRPLVLGECRVGAAQPEPMVATYRGGRWVRQPVPGLVDGSQLEAVSWVGRQAWVSGSSSISGGEALAARWRRGHGWSVVDTGGVDGSLDDIGGAGPRDVWAVGASGCCFRLALHWDGRAFTPDDAGEYGFLEGVAVSGSGVPWAVGQETGSSLILRYEGPLG